jgi:hypothetical protein
MQKYNQNWPPQPPYHYPQYPQNDPYWQHRPLIINQYYLHPPRRPRNYTRSAFRLLSLYPFGYFPALIANIILIIKALGTKARYGRAPGLGCLIATLITSTVLFIFIFLLALSLTRSLIYG